LISPGIRDPSYALARFGGQAGISDQLIPDACPLIPETRPAQRQEPLAEVRAPGIPPMRLCALEGRQASDDI
jgi:hypothetical protein